MKKQTEKMVSIVSSMVNAGKDIPLMAQHYQELQLFCDNQGLDFNSHLTGALAVLRGRCVGIKDSEQLSAFIRGI